MTLMVIPGDQILTVMLGIIAAVGASLVTGLVSRPKMKAEAGAAETGGQVNISGDARAWAQQFADQAAAAGLRADAAERKADAIGDRLDDVEDKMDHFANYCRTLQREIISLGGHPPPPPAELIPPLTHH